MKVLWFTNVPLPAVRERFGMSGQGIGGHWMATLQERVTEEGSVSLGVATAFHGLPNASFRSDGTAYFLVGQSSRQGAFDVRNTDLNECASIVREFQPDLIHIHGTERFFGLLSCRRMTDVPVVVSLQGLLGPYSRYSNYFGALSPLDILRSTRILEVVTGLGLLWGYRDIRKGAIRESEILASVDGYLGRTTWDRAYTCCQNRRAPYHHVGEIMREEFSKRRWTLEAARRHTIIYTNAGHPRRGTETLLSAVAILKEEFPDVQLKLAGTLSGRSGYGRFLRHHIRDLGIEESVVLLGFLDERQMAAELASSHVFAITSFIENSPNSLAEAMQIGMPCVASYVGGIPDMVVHGVTGELFPAGDISLLTAAIRRIFMDDKYSSELGARAREVALERHSPSKAVTELLAAYRDVVATRAGNV